MTPNKTIQWPLIILASTAMVLIAVFADCNGKRAMGLSVITPPADQWTATAYCNCRACCGKVPSDPAYGITSSGKRARAGYVACNWLPIGTEVLIDGKPYKVMDRGAKSIFGDKNNQKKRIDIWMPSHSAALKYGRRPVRVTIMEGTKP